MNTVKKLRNQKKNIEVNDNKKNINADIVTTNVDSFKLPLTANTQFANFDSSDGNHIQYFPNIELLESNPMKALYIYHNGFILLETTNQYVNVITDFLIAIAEPISRPLFIHEYQITVFSLYAAMSMGMTSEEIISRLYEYSKNVLAEQLENAIKELGQAFGKLKLVLKNSHYYVESKFRNEIELLLKCPAMVSARVKESLDVRDDTARESSNYESVTNQYYDKDNVTIDELYEQLNHNEIATIDYILKAEKALNKTESIKTINSVYNQADIAAAEPKVKIYSIEVNENAIGTIKEAALHDLGRPLLTEYDARCDTHTPILNISLKPTTKIRYYQQRALSKMFKNGYARSGIIVLPCGAGKTITGIAAAVAIKKPTMILTSSSVVVEQWKNSFIEFTNIDPNKVVILTADTKTRLPDDACVVCTTYTMISYSGRRSDAASEFMQQIKSRDWGLLIFDEVQFAPAPVFRRVIEICRSHCKLGLTATLVREDNLINDLYWMIGPKLDEANWQELQANGYLAKAKCSEVWCPMTIEFYRAFINVENKHHKAVAGQAIGQADIQRRLWTCNPNKLRVCEYLIKFHESRGDKIIVFSDYLMALKEVARTLKRSFISGDVSYSERMMLINKFKYDANNRTIFLSKVGDNAIDIPCANVVIQISFNYASRRQETQRLGRILRPKSNMSSNSNYNAFFYSLASQDTPEMYYADRRQQYIVDQGYAYQVITMDMLPIEQANLLFSNPNKQKELLQKILTLPTGKEDVDII